jgi:hypothetical protein
MALLLVTDVMGGSASSSQIKVQSSSYQPSEPLACCLFRTDFVLLSMIYIAMPPWHWAATPGPGHRLQAAPLLEQKMSLTNRPLRMVSGVSHFVVGLCICSVPFLLFSAAQMQAVPLPHSPRTSCGDVSESLDEPHPAVDSSSQCSHGITSVAESNAPAAAGPSSGDSCPPMLALPAPTSMQADGGSA